MASSLSNATEETAMSSIPIEADIAALAREVVARYAFVAQFIEEDLGFGLSNIIPSRLNGTD